VNAGVVGERKGVQHYVAMTPVLDAHQLMQLAEQLVQ
jgi:hypothetical protein